jgi:hypothetical protein
MSLTSKVVSTPVKQSSLSFQRKKKQPTYLNGNNKPTSVVSAPFENVLSVTDVLASHFQSGSPKTIPVTLFDRSYVMCFYPVGTGKWGCGPF